MAENKEEGGGEAKSIVDKALGVVPTLYYDLIARIIPGCAFLWALAGDSFPKFSKMLGESTSVAFVAWLGAGYLAGLLLTGVSVVWDMVWCLLAKCKRFGLSSLTETMRTIDRIWMSDERFGDALLKMLAEVTAAENLLSGYLLLLFVRSIGFHGTAIDGLGYDVRTKHLFRILLGLAFALTAIQRVFLLGCRAKRLEEGETPTIESYIVLLKSEDPKVRKAIAEALGQTGRNAKAAVPALTKTLREDSDTNVQEAIAKALVQIGPTAKLRELAQLMNGKGQSVKEAAVDGLVAFCRTARRTQDKLDVAVALGNFGAAAENAVPELTDLLNDKAVQPNAIAALGNIGPAAQQATPALARLLLDAKADIWRAVAEALDKIDPAWTSAIATLITLLNDNTAQLPSIVALGKIGSKASTAVSHLGQLLPKTGAGELKTAIEDALRKIGKHP